jgi:hypothetical protein
MVARAAHHEIHRCIETKNACWRRAFVVFGSAIRGSAKMELEQNHIDRDAPDRPALTALVGAMEKLPRYQRNEVARIGRKARAAKLPRIRRLTWQAVAEARRLAQEAAQ